MVARKRPVEPAPSAAPAQTRIGNPSVEPSPPNGCSPRIPYGRADFRGARLDGSLYVDKTRFVRQLREHNAALRAN